MPNKLKSKQKVTSCQNSEMIHSTIIMHRLRDDAEEGITNEGTTANDKQDKHQIDAMQMRLKVDKRKRYTEEFKSFAISIYYKSPTCYRFLQTRFKLPLKSAITPWLSKVKFHEGSCPNLFKMLKLNVERLPPGERVSVLM